MSEEVARHRSRFRSNRHPNDPSVVPSGRLFILIGLALVLIAVERLIHASLLGFAVDGSRSTSLAIAFICGGLAPFLFGIGCLRASHELASEAQSGTTELEPDQSSEPDRPHIPFLG